MKATILVRDLVKLIAKHGDLDVQVCMEVKGVNGRAPIANAKCIDEVTAHDKDCVFAFEIYGEEQ